MLQFLCSDATHLAGIHASTVLVLGTTFEHLHFMILLHEHRLHRLRSLLPADPHVAMRPMPTPTPVPMFDGMPPTEPKGDMHCPSLSPITKTTGLLC